MRAVIMCAGRATRWNGHLGVNKHQVEVDGERIVDRTVRLLLELGVDDVWTTSDEPMPMDGTHNLVASWPEIGNELTTGLELDRFYNALPLWRGTDEFCYLYGDTYYTEECVRLIVEAKGDFRVIGRSGPSYRTRKPYEEIFGVKLIDFDMAFEALERVYTAHRRFLFADLMKKKDVEPWTERTACWEWYRAVEGFPLREHRIGQRFIECDDWTEDFDWPGDYERWMQQWSAYKLGCRDEPVV